jgi:hypothetical protein
MDYFDITDLDEYRYKFLYCMDKTKDDNPGFMGFRKALTDVYEDRIKIIEVLVRYQKMMDILDTPENPSPVDYFGPINITEGERHHLI